MFTYSGEMTGTPNGDAPSVLATSYNFKAEIEIPKGGAEGMIVTQGGRFAGYGFYLLKGKPVFLWNLVDLKRLKWEGSEALAPGKHTLEFDFKYDGLGAAHARLRQPQRSGSQRHGCTQGRRQGGRDQEDGKDNSHDPAVGRELRCGADTGTPVNDKDYQVPFRFTGKLDKLTLTIDRPKLSPEDIKKLETAMHNNPASE